MRTVDGSLTLHHRYRNLEGGSCSLVFGKEEVSGLRLPCELLGRLRSVKHVIELLWKGWGKALKGRTFSNNASTTSFFSAWSGTAIPL